MKTAKIIYYVSTGLISAMMLMSAGMYFTKHDEISQGFSTLGFPVYLIYPLGAAKVLAIIAIWTNLSASLKEWAYAGLFFVFVLAAAAHSVAGDGHATGAFVAIALLFTSYIAGKRVA
jgi:hypothetical protein